MTAAYRRLIRKRKRRKYTVCQVCPYRGEASGRTMHAGVKDGHVVKRCFKCGTTIILE